MSENKSLTRLEAFSDGIFAIAITLLILEIKVPPVHEIHSNEELTHAILELWPSYFAFLYSFGGILVQWVYQHNIFMSLTRTSNTFLYANGFLLLTLVFFPFTTALLAEYINTENAMPAIVFYNFNTVINAVAWFLFYKALDKPVHIRSASFTDQFLKVMKKSNYFAMAIYTLTTILAIWFPYTCLLINIAIWLVWIILSFNKKEAADQVKN